MTIADAGAVSAADDDPGQCGDAIDAVAFLARSKHRVRVLELLTDGPRTREDLAAGTDATRVTLSRILGDLEDRGWIEHDHADRSYALTRFGRLVFGDFSRLLGTVSVGREHPDLVNRLPTEWFGFDLRCLEDAERVAAADADPLSAARVVANAIREASSCRSLLGTFIALPMYSAEAAVRAGDALEGTVVFDPNVTATMLGDPDLRSRWKRLEAAADGHFYYAVDEAVPCSIDLVDGTAFLTVDREAERGFDILRTDHPDVVEWAGETVERYRAEATPLANLADAKGGE
ncbi:helix-turn-helix transcriptional regulator [Halorubrum amylolyticum]|uniref:helix-turn-helix transcriptional regulator n=1 Tax=Halorubrum amylolyticum TaxID=2508724 RepID=UPI001008ABF5|nr:helix-turn-helix domain-containing protein [Halorubrum amylolyticum]